MAVPSGFAPDWFGITFLRIDSATDTLSIPWDQMSNRYGIWTRDLHIESVANSTAILTGYLEVLMGIEPTYFTELAWKASDSTYIVLSTELFVRIARFELAWK